MHSELIEELRAGGIGVVFRAHDPMLARDVAIELNATIPDGETGELELTGRGSCCLNWFEDLKRIVPVGR